MNYWKSVSTPIIYFTTGLDNIYKNHIITEDSFTKINKTEYDTHVTYPNLMTSNENHQLFQNGETGLAISIPRYKETFKTIVQAYVEVIVPLSKIVTNVEHITNDNLTKLNAFNDAEDLFVKDALNRAKTYHDDILNGLSAEVAFEHAEQIRIVSTGTQEEIDAWNDFISWLGANNPDLRAYVQYSDNLHYDTLVNN